jgi:carbonic anhydrase/acetyltransferase-like protein (isoleucine patch superfamily)
MHPRQTPPQLLDRPSNYRDINGAKIHYTAQIGPSTVVKKGAVIEAGVRIGGGSTVYAMSHIFPHARIGANVRLKHGVVVQNGATIGNNVVAHHGSRIERFARVEDNAEIRAGMTVPTCATVPQDRFFPSYPPRVHAALSNLASYEATLQNFDNGQNLDARRQPR